MPDKKFGKKSFQNTDSMPKQNQGGLGVRNAEHNKQQFIMQISIAQ